MVDRAHGVELLVLPDIWACGYDPVSLADDAKVAAEPLTAPTAGIASRGRSSPAACPNWTRWEPL